MQIIRNLTLKLLKTVLTHTGTTKTGMTDPTEKKIKELFKTTNKTILIPFLNVGLIQLVPFFQHQEATVDAG